MYKLDNVHESIPKVLVVNYLLKGHEGLDLKYLWDGGIDPEFLSTVQEASDLITPESFESYEAGDAIAVYKLVRIVRAKIAVEDVEID